LSSKYKESSNDFKELLTLLKIHKERLNVKTEKLTLEEVEKVLDDIGITEKDQKYHVVFNIVMKLSQYSTKRDSLSLVPLLT